MIEAKKSNRWLDGWSRWMSGLLVPLTGWAIGQKIMAQ